MLHPGYLSRNNMALLIGATFLFVSAGMMSYLLPFYLLSINVSLAGIGLILAFNPIIFGVLRFTFGSTGDFTDRRALLWLSGMIQAGTALSYPNMRDLPILTTLSMTSGMSSSLRQASITPLLVDLNANAYRGKLLAIFQSTGAGGTALGFLAGGILLVTVDYFPSFTVSAALAGVGLVCYLLVTSDPSIAKTRFDLRQLFSLRGFNRNTLIMVLAFALSGIAVSMGEVFALPLILETEFAVPRDTIGVILALTGLTQGLTGLLLSGINDRVNPRWISGVLSIIGGSLFFVMYSAPTLIIFILPFFVYHALVGLVFNNRWKIIGDACRPHKSGKDSSIPSLGLGLTSFVASIAAGIIAQLLGYRLLYGFEGVFWIFHGLTIILLVVQYPSLASLRLSRTK